MGLGGQDARAAQVMLNAVARRLLIWKDWWRDHGFDLVATDPGNELYELNEYIRQLEERWNRLDLILSEAKSTVEEVQRYQGNAGYCPGEFVDLYGESEEVRELLETLDKPAALLVRALDSVKERREAVQRLLKDKEGEQQKDGTDG